MSNHSVSTFRTLGSAATPQNLFTLWNGDASKVIRIRALSANTDQTAVLTAVTSQLRVSRPSGAPSGGTALTKSDWDSSAASDADVVCRGATASDGGAATAITATAGTTIWQEFIMRLHTAVGQVLGYIQSLLPRYIETYPIILRPSDGILVQLVNPTAASNLATNHYVINCAWTEDAS